MKFDQGDCQRQAQPGAVKAARQTAIDLAKRAKGCGDVFFFYTDPGINDLNGNPALFVQAAVNAYRAASGGKFYGVGNKV